MGYPFSIKSKLCLCFLVCPAEKAEITSCFVEFGLKVEEEIREMERCDSVKRIQ